MIIIICLIAVLAVVISFIIIGVRRRLWGLLIMAAGVVGTLWFYFSRKVYLIFAKNPGIVLNEPNGSNILYISEVERLTKWLIIWAVVAGIGLAILLLELLMRHRKSRTTKENKK